MSENLIQIYTDGSCLGNPGHGGWAAIIMMDAEEHTISGGQKDTTNNRMEMTAIIKALEWLHKKSGLKQNQLAEAKVQINSDSNLIIQTLNQGWKRKANIDLWEQLDKLRGWLNIEWKWVKGHHTNKYNNLVDKLAVNEARKVKG